MTPAIRAAGVMDLQTILALEVSIQELPHWPRTEYERYVTMPGALDRVLCVAETDGVLLGFAAAASNASIPGLVELENIAVLPTMRRSGIGRQLCRYVMAWSQQRQREVLELEVRSGNSGAIALYHSLGFQPMRVRSRYYVNPVDDALLLSLVL